MHDPTPILCRACGGSVEEPRDVAWRCPHCGTPDELPPDVHARVRELRRRIDLRARQLTQLSNIEAALALAFEQPGQLRRLLTPIVGGTLLVLLPAIPNHLARLRVPPPHGIGLAGLLASLAWYIGFPAAIAGAFYFSRRVYRREYRGFLQPLPPRQLGSNARCRCCGAELPREYGPLIRCQHCRTHSLVTATQQAQQAPALVAETRRGAQRLGKLVGKTARFGLELDQIFAAAFVVFYVAVVALAMLVR